MPSGGANLLDLRPLDPDGRLYADRVGCHRAEYEHLNVRNAQPGYVYHYAKRKSARIQTLLRRGYKVVGPDDPERLGESHDENLRAAGLDGLQTTDDLVLLKCPEHLTRRRREDRIARNQQALTGATSEFLSPKDPAEARYAQSAGPERPIRFKGPKHQTQTIER